ncbi:MAG: shikimate kinase [Deltaproteobacteria bacterium]|nr:shikimate kinase [Deltaproteobacteria bacterium]
MNTIILIGHRCTGKTSVGRLLAHRLGLDFIDADELIESRSNLTVREIVARGGWPLFREKEKEILRELARRPDAVIAAGGGSCDDPENRKLLKEENLVVWLTADAETIIERMGLDTQSGERRPSLTGTDVLEETMSLLSQRAPLFREIADLAIDTTGKTVADVVGLIVDFRLHAKEFSCPEVQ